MAEEKKGYLRLNHFHGLRLESTDFIKPPQVFVHLRITTIWVRFVVFGFQRADCRNLRLTTDLPAGCVVRCRFRHRHPSP